MRMVGCMSPMLPRMRLVEAELRFVGKVEIKLQVVA